MLINLTFKVSVLWSTEQKRIAGTDSIVDFTKSILGQVCVCVLVFVHAK